MSIRHRCVAGWTYLWKLAVSPPPHIDQPAHLAGQRAERQRSTQVAECRRCSTSNDFRVSSAALHAATSGRALLLVQIDVWRRIALLMQPLLVTSDAHYLEWTRR